jgi:hypothetical protein
MRHSEAVPTGEGVLLRKDSISVEAAAEKYPIGSKDWYYQHMRNGTLPFPWWQFSAGKRVMRISDIENHISRRMVPAAKKPGYKEEAPMRK